MLNLVSNVLGVPNYFFLSFTFYVTTMLKNLRMRCFPFSSMSHWSSAYNQKNGLMFPHWSERAQPCTFEALSRGHTNQGFYKIGRSANRYQVLLRVRVHAHNSPRNCMQALKQSWKSLAACDRPFISRPGRPAEELSMPTRTNYRVQVTEFHERWFCRYETGKTQCWWTTINSQEWNSKGPKACQLFHASSGRP